MHREKREGSRRVLIAAPTERDASVAERILRDEKLETRRCGDFEELCREIEAGAGVVLIAEEHLVGARIDRLKRWFEEQPKWSDLPLIVLLSPGPRRTQQVQELEQCANVTFLTRPVRVAAYVSAVQSSLRDRSRQYAVRDLLIEKESAHALMVASERRLSMALQAGGMAAWEWTPQRSIWSDSLYALLGIPRSAAASPELFFQNVHPDDVQGLHDVWQDATAGKRAYHHEFRVIRPDGEVRWLVGVGELVRDAEGEVAQMFGLNWDITRQRTVASELQESEQRFRQLADAMPQMVFAADPAGRLDYLNERAFRYVGTASSYDAAWWAALDPEDAERAKVRWANAISSGRSFQIEYRVRNQETGETRWHLGRALPVRNEAGEIIRWFGTCTDIHEQKLVQEKLNRALEAASAANVAKSEFLANMSHEIRTPMTAVLGYTDLLVRGESDPEKAEFLRTIKRNGSFLLEIINDILDLSKIEAGKMELSRERFAPHDVLRDVWSMMRGRAAEKKLQFELDYEGPIPRQIESDPKRLRQILVNLIGNAIKFTESGRVRVATRYLGNSDGGLLEFCVIDTGVGIPESKQKRLFQPFTQGDASVSRQFGGSGLGLAISQRLARMLGGKISVQSEERQGSTFCFALSVAADEAADLIQPHFESTPEPTPAADLNRRFDGRVLVVDDRRDVRFLVGHLLKKTGVEVAYATDGIEAIRAVEQTQQSEQSYDMILLDMQMPRLDGYQTALRLREIGYRQPLIALTADVMQGDMDRCLDNGCDGYLSKPIDAQQLLSMVERFVSPSESR